MPEEPSWGWNDKNSILNVSWNDAIKYCKWLSKKIRQKHNLAHRSTMGICCQRREQK